MTTRQQLVDEARQWIGTPFVHQAYRKGIGADCIGLIAGVALSFAMPDAVAWAQRPDCHNYAEQPDPKMLLRLTNEFLLPVCTEYDALMPADIVLMRFESDPMHFALVTSLTPFLVVHALSRLGRVAEHHIDRAWQQRIMRIYRYRGLTQWHS
jgi:cell wall-associated NlpC family hydrolase